MWADPNPTAPISSHAAEVTPLLVLAEKPVNHLYTQVDALRDGVRPDVPNQAVEEINTCNSDNISRAYSGKSRLRRFIRACNVRSH